MHREHFALATRRIASKDRLILLRGGMDDGNGEA